MLHSQTLTGSGTVSRNSSRVKGSSQNCQYAGILIFKLSYFRDRPCSYIYVLYFILYSTRNGIIQQGYNEEFDMTTELSITIEHSMYIRFIPRSYFLFAPIAKNYPQL